MKLKLLTVMLFCGFFISACGGDSLDLAEGGMTGTGITAGRITGFGSIYVNGIHYNVDNATFYRDGEMVSGQEDYGVGEFVTVTGGVVADDNEAVANEVVFNSLIRGEVTSQSADNLTLRVIGQRIETDELTVLHGFESLTELRLGNIVEISGIQDTNDTITASSIALLEERFNSGDSELRFEGSISNLSIEQQTFDMGGVTVDYSGVNLKEGEQELRNGQYVRVMSRQAVNNQRVLASEITLKKRHIDYVKDVYLEIEGQITAIDSSSSFTLNGQLVETSSQTIWLGISSAGLALNRTIEVEGVIDDFGVLQATKVSSRKARDNERVSFTGNISAINTNNNTFELLGNTFVISNVTILLGERENTRRHPVISINQLNVGDYVDIQAIEQVDNTYNVLRLDLGGRDDAYSSHQGR